MNMESTKKYIEKIVGEQMAWLGQPHAHYP